MLYSTIGCAYFLEIKDWFFFFTRDISKKQILSDKKNKKQKTKQNKSKLNKPAVNLIQTEVLSGEKHLKAMVAPNGTTD